MGPISIIDSDNPSLRVFFARAPSAWNDFPPYGLASTLCCLVLDSSLSQQGSLDPNSAFLSHGTLFQSPLLPVWFSSAMTTSQHRAFIGLTCLLMATLLTI